MSTSHTRNSGKKAQASVELISYAAFFFLIFVAAVAIFFQLEAQEMTRAQNANAQQIATGFADEIHSAYVAGPGYWEIVTVPTSTLNQPYNLSITYATSAVPSSMESTGFVYLEWQGQSGPMSYSAPTVTNAFISNQWQVYSGRITIQVNSTTPSVNISNQNGTIDIEPG